MIARRSKHLMLSAAYLPACLACPRLEKRARSRQAPGRGNQRLSGQFLGEAALPPSSPESNDGDPASAAGTSSCQEGIRQDEGDDVHEVQSHESGSSLFSILCIFLSHMTLPKHRSYSFFSRPVNNIESQHFDGMCPRSCVPQKTSSSCRLSLISEFSGLHSAK